MPEAERAGPEQIGARAAIRADIGPLLRAQLAHDLVEGLGRSPMLLAL
jgi:hypothetical protein